MASKFEFERLVDWIDFGDFPSVVHLFLGDLEVYDFVHYVINSVLRIKRLDEQINTHLLPWSSPSSAPTSPPTLVHPLCPLQVTPTLLWQTLTASWPTPTPFPQPSTLPLTVLSPKNPLFLTLSYVISSSPWFTQPTPEYHNNLRMTHILS
ncbi:hypothetical protein E4T56_gene14431 [Termitomyces sp. T112]|nr:hypothetical protein E4T56_gene14431 [Termitomyces sp. T112]